jgi:hypothetical protein
MLVSILGAASKANLSIDDTGLPVPAGKSPILVDLPIELPWEGRYLPETRLVTSRKVILPD